MYHVCSKDMSIGECLHAFGVLIFIRMIIFIAIDWHSRENGVGRRRRSCGIWRGSSILKGDSSGSSAASGYLRVLLVLSITSSLTRVRTWWCGIWGIG